MENPNGLPGRPGLAPGTCATTEYDSRPPSPPNVEILMCPMGLLANESRLHEDETMALFNMTTQNTYTRPEDQRQASDHRAPIWHYEKRRAAHAILDFLYVGPTSVARDHGFLRQEGITMILVANEMRQPGQKLKSIEAAAEALGIEVMYVDTEPNYQQVAAFNETTQIINDHILASQAGDLEAVSPRTKNGKPSKVLVVCESGNTRSCLIVASYIMATYSRTVSDTVRFMLARRLSCTFEEPSKRALTVWWDILQARQAVASQRAIISPTPTTGFQRTAKRGLVDASAMEMDEDDSDMATSRQDAPMDEERFAGREAFTPFRDLEAAQPAINPGGQ